MAYEVKSERVNFGWFQDCLDLEKYDIDPDTVGGAFFSEAKLLAAHEKVPQFHIVSFVRRDLVYIANRYVPGWNSYHLSMGNADPTLEESGPPLSHADVDEIEKALRASGSGVADSLARIYVTILRGMLSGHVSLDGIVDREHQLRVRGAGRDRAQRRRRRGA